MAKASSTKKPKVSGTKDPWKQKVLQGVRKTKPSGNPTKGTSGVWKTRLTQSVERKKKK